MQRWPARVFAVPVVVLLLMAGVQTVGASSAHVTTPVLHVPSAGGPGYELQISNNLYAFNAPQLASMPTNPTEGAQKCSIPTTWTCSGVGIASVGDNANPGYWVATAASRVTDGRVAYGADVTGIGNTGTCGNVGTINSNVPVVGVAAAQYGALLVGSDGGVFALCGAQFYGSMGGQPLNKPVVGIAATPDGGGYWLVASDGGVFSFGDAAFYGSMGGKPLNQPMVGMASTPDGNGYWLVASDGGVFSFGDAVFSGSMGGKPLNKPMVAIAANPDGTGYWTAASDGGIFSFGDAPFRGSGTGAHGVLQGIAANG